MNDFDEREWECVPGKLRVRIVGVDHAIAFFLLALANCWAVAANPVTLPEVLTAFQNMPLTFLTDQLLTNDLGERTRHRGAVWPGIATSSFRRSPVPVAGQEGKPPLMPVVARNTQENPVSIRERINHLREDPQWDWKRPIRFFGKVVDENEQPLQGAAASFNWSNAAGDEREKSILTDAGGLFSLVGERGKRLQVRIRHPDFHTPSTNQISFEYADVSDRNFYRPDANAPVVFHLKRKAGAEPLLAFRKASQIPKDGIPLYVDLLRGIVTAATGQVQLQCWTLDHETDTERRYDWKCIVSVLGGGLVESTNELDFAAPADGYRVMDVIEMPKSLGADWRPRLEKDYFVKLANGFYGRMHLTIITGGDHFFRIESFVNPSGSRNLEFDPAVQPKQTEFE